MKLSSAGLKQQQSPEGETNYLNSELWHACAGPLVSLPAIGSHVVYFPQGHSEQGPIAIRMANRAIDGGVEVSMASGLGLEGDCYEQLLHANDRLEGLAAFAEK